MGRAPRGSEAGYETRLNVIRLEMINGDGKDGLASPLNLFLFDVFLFFPLSFPYYSLDGCTSIGWDLEWDLEWHGTGRNGMGWIRRAFIINFAGLARSLSSKESIFQAIVQHSTI